MPEKSTDMLKGLWLFINESFGEWIDLTSYQNTFTYTLNECTRWYRWGSSINITKFTIFIDISQSRERAYARVYCTMRCRTCSTVRRNYGHNRKSQHRNSQALLLSAQTKKSAANIRIFVESVQVWVLRGQSPKDFSISCHFCISAGQRFAKTRNAPYSSIVIAIAE